jgi:hypothetical protein
MFLTMASGGPSSAPWNFGIELDGKLSVSSAIVVFYLRLSAKTKNT